MPAQSSSTAPSSEALPAAAGTGSAPSFESAMERLEAIVEQMEHARLPLEELIRSYEEGTQLIKVCSERLSAAEQRIEMITRDAAGQASVAEYPTAAANPAAVPSPSLAPRAARQPKVTPEPSMPAPSASRPNQTPNEVSLF